MRKSMIALVATLGVAVMVAVSLAQRSGGPRGDGARTGRGFPPPPPSPLMEALDTNHDGVLSAEEIAAAPQVLKKLDENHDGKLSRDELRGPPPGGPGPDFGGPGGPGDAGGRTSMEAAPSGKDDAEKKVLQAIENITKEQGRRMNVPPTDGRLLRLLTESLGAKNVVEIGTSNGISSIWMALALKKTGGKLITHEIDPDTAALARKNFATAGVSDLITVVEGDAHEKVSELKGPFDLAFIDADKEGYLDYFKKLLPLMRPGGLILAHNMTPRMADPGYLKAITTSPEVETLFYLQGGGMGVTLKKR